MPGNGFFSRDEGVYKAYPTRTWDGDSAGITWNDFVEWDADPGVTLTYTTNVIDTFESKKQNPTIQIEASQPAIVTIYYGDTVDSAGGSIDSASSVVVSPSQSNIGALKARYFQFEVTLDPDSGGIEFPNFNTAPFISKITTAISTGTTTKKYTDIDISTLSGSVGQRTLNIGSGGNLNVGNVLTQIQHQSITDDSGGAYITPVCYVEKTATNLVLHVFDVDSYGKRKRVDCVIDLQVELFPNISSDLTGSINEEAV